MPENKTDQELADMFTNFFLHKISTIREDLNLTPRYKPLASRVTKLASFRALSQQEVKSIINSLSKKTCELDCMPTKLLKEILDTILPVITQIINSSLEQGTFAACWKTAIIRPLFKKAGLDLIANNYRPVSNLPFLSKVLEKAALIQLMEHCNKNDLIPDYQSAYRAHYSCETALVKLMNDLLWAMEQQEVTALMAIDLSAAFDTVDHDILVSVLEAKFGIEAQALNWFDSYLRQRSCKVNVGKAYSEPKHLPFSVPQGSCAGPVLYLLYASTMQEEIEQNIDLHGYADDHALKIKFLPTKNETIAISTLEKCSRQIKNWMDGNRLKMNTSKN